jgi:hypothetical protein
MKKSLLILSISLACASVQAQVFSKRSVTNNTFITNCRPATDVFYYDSRNTILEVPPRTISTDYGDGLPNKNLYLSFSAWNKTPIYVKDIRATLEKAQWFDMSATNIIIEFDHEPTVTKMIDGKWRITFDK